VCFFLFLYGLLYYDKSHVAEERARVSHCAWTSRVDGGPECTAPRGQRQEPAEERITRKESAAQAHEPVHRPGRGNGLRAPFATTDCLGSRELRDSWCDTGRLGRQEAVERRHPQRPA